MLSILSFLVWILFTLCLGLVLYSKGRRLHAVLVWSLGLSTVAVHSVGILVVLTLAFITLGFWMKSRKDGHEKE